jgi:NhaP-type Na+/H+ or K+/H+ antiporter
LLLFMAVASSLVERLPMTAGLAYLAVGVALGPHAARLIDVDLQADARLIEHITEIALLFSLFSAGLKLRVALGESRWKAPLRLATAGVAVSVILIAGAAVLVLGVPWPVAVVIAAILSPTDPVLASEVQVTHPDDRDRVRLTLTGEAGLNDGTAFPFLFLGLAMLGAHDVGAFGWRWLLVDVVWASAAGVAVGWFLGWSVGRFVVYLRQQHQQAHGVDDFVALGLIAASYGLALAVNGYGFLAVFAAGLSMRQLDTDARAQAAAPLRGQKTRADARKDPASAHHLARQVLSFNLQMERIGEVVVVILLGALLSRGLFSLEAVLFALAIFFLIRPLTVLISVAGVRLSPAETALIGWFGVRGAGSVFYLAYAIAHGLDPSVASTVANAVLPAVALSVVIHGISVTPFMKAYERRRGARKSLRAAAR